ncbi:hypothetical protein C0J52_02406 [Blattella germanica]|nr:hypothetical protein C0J52_02406 [Blattella germanica]
MNYENYSKWVQHQMIPGLPERSIVVIDNAPYHNKQDNKIPSTSLKSEIQEWLWNNNIPFDPDMTKAELLIRAKQYRPKKIYSKLFTDAGFTTLRLSPYHPDMNTIELIWNLVKAKVAYNNTDHVSLLTLKSLSCDSIGAITVNDWKNSVQKVKSIQETYWKRDLLVEEEMERLIINPGLDSSDELGEETATGSETNTASEGDFAE